MENVTEIILLAVSVIVVGVIVIAGFSLMTESRKVPNTMVAQINEVNKNMEEYQYTKYVDMTLSGSDVLSAARKLWNKSAEVCIYYGKTGDLDLVMNQNSLDITTFQNLPSNSRYINPNDEYTASIIRDKNTGLISEIDFRITKKNPIVQSVTGENTDGHESGLVDSVPSLKGNSATGDEEESNTQIEESAESAIESEGAIEETNESLDVVFSDEAGNGKTETEESAVLKKFKEELANLQNEFDKIDLSELNGESSEFVLQAKIDELNTIRDKAISLRDEYIVKNVSSSNKKFIETSGNHLFNSISEVIDSLATTVQEEEVVE